MLACLLLLLVVLLQQGKGGDMASAFGGGGSQTAFGARGGRDGADEGDAILGALFMMGAIVLGIIGQRGRRLADGRHKAPAPAPALPSATPAAPAPTTPAPQPATPAETPAQAAGSEPDAGEGAREEVVIARLRRVPTFAKVAELADAPA